eukprot:GHRR01004920.1.p1 GENE.GHRR01004920.1~~GHRR01004920.1.p1  ORF type:complete len:281 (+),score=88.56 GHRR01004920.1:62-844(+)
MERTLVVLHGSCLPLAQVQTALNKQNIASESADITTDPAHSTAAGYGRAVLLCSQADAAVLGATSKLLRPGACVVLQLIGSEQEDVASSMVLSGFVECQVSRLDGVTTVTAKLPAFAVGSKDTIRLTPKAAAAPAAAPQAANAWLLSADDMDDELVDDEELLTEEDKQRPTITAKNDDCEVGASGARKACKNCTCGRAEAEAMGEKVKLTQEMLDNPQSSCGSCALGDAFRCAGCPYRGLPAFEAGKKIQLPADFLTADA